MVLDGAMQNLPPSLLPRSPAPEEPEAYGRYLERPAPEQFKPFQHLDYLGKHVAISILPSVSSFKGLRQAVQAPTGRKPFIRFGNLDFKGGIGENRAVTADQLPITRDLQSIREATRGLFSLPESEDEVRQLAASLGAGVDSLYVGPDANESQVKRLDLEGVQTLAFATHGIVDFGRR